MKGPKRNKGLGCKGGGHRGGRRKCSAVGIGVTHPADGWQCNEERSTNCLIKTLDACHSFRNILTVTFYLTVLKLNSAPCWGTAAVSKKTQHWEKAFLKRISLEWLLGSEHISIWGHRRNSHVHQFKRKKKNYSRAF